MRGKLLKLISGSTATLMLATILLIFICPMSGVAPMAHGASGGQIMCADANLLDNFGAMSACVDMHLANARRFISNLFSPVAVWLGVVVLAFGLALINALRKNFLINLAQVIAIRLRQRFRLFYHSIRQKFQKTFLAYLANLENSGNVSVV